MPWLGPFFLCAVLIALIFMIRKKIYRRPTIIFRSSQEDSNRTSFHPIGHLLIYVLCEVIGLFGFVVVLFLTGSLQLFLNLMLDSITLMVVLNPRRMAESNL